MNQTIYKFTFEDGTEAIAHYGVKGMKWGKNLKALDPEYLKRLGLSSKRISELTSSQAGANVMPGSSSPGMGKIYDQKELSDSHKRMTDYYKVNPIDKQWNDFTHKVTHNKVVSDAQKVASGVKRYGDDVVSKGTRFGSDVSNTSRTLSNTVDALTKGDYKATREGIQKTGESIGRAAASGRDYLSSLLGESVWKRNRS